MDSENRHKVAKLEQLLENVRERAHGTPDDDLTGVVGASLFGRESVPEPAPFSEPVPDHISTLPPPPAGVAPPPPVPVPMPFLPAPSSPDIDALDVAWDDDATVIARSPLSYDLPPVAPVVPAPAIPAPVAPVPEPAPAAAPEPVTTPPPAPEPAPAPAAVSEPPTPPPMIAPKEPVRTTLVPPRNVTTAKPPAPKPEPVAASPKVSAPPVAPIAPMAPAAPRLTKRERRAKERAAARSGDDKAALEARTDARREKARAKQNERKERARAKEEARKAKAKVPLHELPRDPNARESDVAPKPVKAPRAMTAARAERAAAKKAAVVPDTMAGKLFGTERDRAQWKMLGLIVAVVATVAAIGVAILHR